MVKEEKEEEKVIEEIVKNKEGEMGKKEDEEKKVMETIEE